MVDADRWLPMVERVVRPNPPLLGLVLAQMAIGLDQPLTLLYTSRANV